MPVTICTDPVTLSTKSKPPYRFFLRREIGSASTHYTLTTPREARLRQHGRFFFRGVGVAFFIRIYGVLGTKGSLYTKNVISNLLT